MPGKEWTVWGPRSRCCGGRGTFAPLEGRALCLIAHPLPGADLPTIESLCLHLTSELAGHGDRPLRLLRALAEVYRRPAYADAVLRGGGPDCPPPGSPVPPPGGPAPS
eukprot:EG_transcript_28580